MWTIWRCLHDEMKVGTFSLALLLLLLVLRLVW